MAPNLDLQVLVHTFLNLLNIFYIIRPCNITYESLNVTNEFYSRPAHDTAINTE